MKYRRFFWQSLTAFSILLIACYASVYVFYSIFQSEKSAIIISMLVSLCLGLYLAFRLSRPLENLLERVKLVEGGHLNEVVDLSRNETSEIHDIARLMDAIASQLNSRIDVIRQQKDEQEAILQSLDEGLIAIDSKRQITHLNPAAFRIFKDYTKLAIGKKIEEVIRHAELQSMIMNSMSSQLPKENDIEFLGAKIRYLRIHTSPLIARNNEYGGLVLVINDVTRMRQLEGMRKNFVANVSHELRTPLTSIQGFAETLMNPSVKDPKEIRKFVEIIQRHAMRLGRIIEDILALSRIEKDAESHQIDKKLESLEDILASVVELCNVRAEKKQMQIKLAEIPSVEFLCDRYLLEQALINLIDNAIRYSDEGQAVRLLAELVQNELRITIEDDGVGIAENQLPKIFERFYRVDRARSRELGGTGLGLSIVKHIAIAHGGKVDVTSQLGKGSAFSLTLPLT